MKKPIIIIIALIILGVIVWKVGGNRDSGAMDIKAPDEESVSAPVSEAVKVSDKLSEFRNGELGFAVKYPSVWERAPGDEGVSLTIPTGAEKTNTIGRLEAKVMLTSGKCAFPPVTTIKERDTLKVGDLNFNMISMSNSVQGRDYFDRMYSHQRDNVCYILHLSSITLSPTSKGYKGSEATQMTNNNKAIVAAADAAFMDMVKSFAYVVGPAGKDEAAVNPAQ